MTCDRRFDIVDISENRFGDVCQSQCPLREELIALALSRIQNNAQTHSINANCKIFPGGITETTVTAFSHMGQAQTQIMGRGDCENLKRK
ncbi:hypothetical protein KW795_01895 [Candidatus Microgenomates bacterium]|nr:hypothetical protein [Candidatus Microgenomates bacterium]